MNAKPAQQVPVHQQTYQPASAQRQPIKPTQGLNSPKKAGKKNKDTLRKPKAISRPPVVQPQN